jgi:hypothetical protein
MEWVAWKPGRFGLLLSSEDLLAGSSLDLSKLFRCETADNAHRVFAGGKESDKDAYDTRGDQQTNYGFPYPCRLHVFDADINLSDA